MMLLVVNGDHDVILYISVIISTVLVSKEFLKAFRQVMACIVMRKYETFNLFTVAGVKFLKKGMKLGYNIKFGVK